MTAKPTPRHGAALKRYEMVEELMAVMADHFRVKGVSDGDAIASILTVAGMLVAAHARDSEHLRHGIKLAHHHIRKVATAYAVREARETLQ